MNDHCTRKKGGVIGKDVRETNSTFVKLSSYGRNGNDCSHVSSSLSHYNGTDDSLSCYSNDRSAKMYWSRSHRE